MARIFIKFKRNLSDYVGWFLLTLLGSCSMFGQICGMLGGDVLICYGVCFVLSFPLGYFLSKM